MVVLQWVGYLKICVSADRDVRGGVSWFGRLRWLGIVTISRYPHRVSAVLDVQNQASKL